MRDAAGQLTVGTRLPVDDEALDVHLRAIALRHGRFAIVFLAAFTALLWPTDWLVFRHLPAVRDAVGALRLALLTTMAADFALLHTAWGSRRPNLVLGTGGAVILLIIGHFLGHLGNPDQPWVHLGYPALFFSVLAPLKLRQRVLLVASLTVAFCAGAIWAFPLHLGAPLTGLMLSFVISMAAMVVAVGNLSFRILRQSFYQSLALERASRELADVNEELETRVRAQTRDLRRLAEHLESAREQERTRIARELHDELGQQLTALNLALALAQRRFADDPQRIGANLSEIGALLTRTHAKVRQLVTELRPLPLEELGLRAAVEGLARQTEQHGGLRCRVEVAALETVRPEVGAALFRIVQEALTNVARHARARVAEVVATTREGALELTVSDDGIGLPPAQPLTGFGLIGIRERVTTLGGRLELRARPGGGTTLAVTLPLPAPAHARELPRSA